MQCLLWTVSCYPSTFSLFSLKLCVEYVTHRSIYLTKMVFRQWPLHTDVSEELLLLKIVYSGTLSLSRIEFQASRDLPKHGKLVTN